MDMAPENKIQTGAGVFTSYAHDLSGKASLFCGDDDNKAIRLEDFNMLAGPDVYVFISKSNNYSKSNVIEVAKLTSGYMDSDINFDFKSQTLYQRIQVCAGVLRAIQFIVWFRRTRVETRSEKFSS